MGSRINFWQTHAGSFYWVRGARRRLNAKFRYLLMQKSLLYHPIGLPLSAKHLLMQTSGKHQTIEMVTTIVARVNLLRGISCRPGQPYAMNAK